MQSSFYYLYEYANKSTTIWYNYDTNKYIIYFLYFSLSLQYLLIYFH